MPPSGVGMWVVGGRANEEGDVGGEEEGDGMGRK